MFIITIHFFSFLPPRNGDALLEFSFYSFRYIKKKVFKKQATQQTFGPLYFDRAFVFGEPNVPRGPNSIGYWTEG